MAVPSGSLWAALCPAASGLEGGFSCVYMLWRRAGAICLFPKQGSGKTSRSPGRAVSTRVLRGVWHGNSVYLDPKWLPRRRKWRNFCHCWAPQTLITEVTIAMYCFYSLIL